MTTETMSLTDACVILGMPSDEVSFLLTGLNNPSVVEPITLRQALGCRLAAELIALMPHAGATAVAATAANYADLNSHRLLVVACPDGEAKACWHDASLPFDEPVRPMLVVAADAAFRALTQRLAEHRASTARPN